MLRSIHTLKAHFEQMSNTEFLFLLGTIAMPTAVLLAWQLFGH